ncbi:ATP-grasp domain-containing protein [Treponema pectinovorum]|uniref:ATP-grasp domain-containing protein n=1 Tax=Treponema pectinovorum TaxID=164 RepID=UPI0011C8E8B7|nr:ATP-grasp domain-containing protein [Treponema pectinovorum]
MNLLIISPGRRVDIVEFFKKEFHENNGHVYTLDMSSYAAALYCGDKYFVVKKNFDDLESYIKDIIKICRENNISYVLTLVDPELELLAKYKDLFIKEKIYPIVSSYEEVKFTFDKYLFYKTVKDKLPVLPTYIDFEAVKKALDSNIISFPLFAKPRNGSGSAGISKIENIAQLELYKNVKDFIFQPYGKNKEFGVDLYFDMISHKIVNFFIKEKLAMRSGETDKAISIKNDEIERIIMKLEDFNFCGPIDVDIFEDNNHKYYINEINPRFGGGYPHAYNCGVNFMKYIMNNLLGKSNTPELGSYKKDIVMMKYNGLCFKSKNELAK